MTLLRAMRQTFYHILIEKLSVVYGPLTEIDCLIILDRSKKTHPLHLEVSELAEAIARESRMSGVIDLRNDVLNNTHSVWRELSGNRTLIILANKIDERPSSGSIRNFRVEELKFDAARLRGVITDALEKWTIECQVRSSYSVPFIYGRQGLEGVIQYLENAVYKVELMEFCRSIGRGWVYNGVAITEMEIFEWILQFQSRGYVENAKAILRYLLQNGFVDKEDMVKELKWVITKWHKKIEGDVIICMTQEEGKSEKYISYFFRPAFKMVKLKEALEIAAKSKKRTRILCVDDVIGSGKTMRKALFEKNEYKNVMERLLQMDKIEIYVLSYFMSERGKREIGQWHRNIYTDAVFVVDDRHRAFTEVSEILAKKYRGHAFKTFCEEVGGDIYSKEHALGWENAQWCVVLEHSVPNQSLPIIHQEGNEMRTWMPLFVRDRTVRPAK